MKRQAIGKLNSIIDFKTPRRQVKSTTLGWEKVVKESWKLLMCILGQPQSCRWRYYAESVTDDSPSAPTAQRLSCTRGLRRTRVCVEGRGGVVCCPTRWNISPLRQQKILHSNELGVGRLGVKDKEEVLIFSILSRWTIQRSSSGQLLVVQLLFQGLTVHDGGLGG